MDEVGRGTSVTTAIALAFASVHHLYKVNQCRALFATHFHEIADMLGYNEETRRADGFFDKVAFYCTDVDELEVRAPLMAAFKLITDNTEWSIHVFASTDARCQSR